MQKRKQSFFHLFHFFTNYLKTDAIISFQVMFVGFLNKKVFKKDIDNGLDDSDADEKEQPSQK